MRNIIAILIVCQLFNNLGHAQEMSAIALDDLSAFQPAVSNWQITGKVTADFYKENVLKTEKGQGVLVNLPTEKHKSNLTSRLEHGDMDLELEFMMAKNSNSGIYLQGRYEIQLLDSWGVKSPRSGDCGGIYERWDDKRPEGQKGYQGYAPRVNVARAPGLWQKLEISFQAPRFDGYGNKTANARILRVALNGLVIHENVELTGPTRGGIPEEAARGAILLQGDHGPVAFRNIRYRRYDKSPLNLGRMTYAYFNTKEDRIGILDELKPEFTGQTVELTHAMATTNEGFTLRFTGELDIVYPGQYHFDMIALGWGRLLIDGKAVIPTDDWEASGSVELESGRHPFEIAYFKKESWYPKGLGLFVSGPGIRRQALHALGSVPSNRMAAPIQVAYEPDPVLLRSFVDYRSHPDSAATRITHAISVGYPEGLSFSYDLKSGTLFQVWKGGFIDATPMWNSRGDGSTRPLGSVLLLGRQAVLAQLNSASGTWPDEPQETFRPKGYELDKQGRPAFSYQYGSLMVQDKIISAADGRSLSRSVEVQGVRGSSWYFLLAAGHHISETSGRLYAIDQSFYIKLPEKTAYKPLLRNAAGRQELLIPLSGIGGFQYEIIW